MGKGIPICGEVVQAGTGDDLKGLACSHGGRQRDLVPKNRPVILTSPERVTALGLAEMRRANGKIGRQCLGNVV